MRYMKIEDLQPGLTVGEAVVDASSHVLITAGVKITEKTIRALKTRGLSGIIIDDEFSAGITPGRVVSASFEQEVLGNIMNLEIDRLQLNAKELVSEALKDQSTLADVNFIKDYDNYTFQHSMSVGYMSAICGIASGFNRREIENITCAGLLHDIGKVFINREIINAPRKLTDEEYNLIKTHSKNGYDLLLKDEYSISATIRVAVYQHHENENGSGYPRGLKQEEVHKFGKIIHICDVFDALTSDRPYRSPMPRTEALKYIQNNTGTMFNPFYSEVFMRITPPYPTGVEIDLAPNIRALVVSNDVKQLDNPLVRIRNLKEDVRLKDIKAVLNIP